MESDPMGSDQIALASTAFGPPSSAAFGFSSRSHASHRPPEHGISMRHPSLLLWVGDWAGPELATVANWCHQHFDAVTFRSDWDSVADSDLSWTHLVVARRDSRRIDDVALDRWIQQHPTAIRVEVRGSMASEFYRHLDERFNGRVVPAGGAVAVLSRTLNASGATPGITTGRFHVVCAARHRDAEPMAERLAASGGGVVIATSVPRVLQNAFHNVTDYWWDDSIVSPASLAPVIDRIGHPGRVRHHVLVHPHLAHRWRRGAKPRNVNVYCKNQIPPSVGLDGAAPMAGLPAAA